MPFAALIGISFAPTLVMLSPVTMAVARNCIDWGLIAKAVRADRESPRPCPRPKPILM